MKAKNKQKRIQKQKELKEKNAQLAKQKHEKYLASLGIQTKSAAEKKKQKEQRRQDFLDSYKKSFDIDQHHTRETWCDGKTVKKSLITTLPSDTQEINQRRKQIGLDDIEIAERQAQEEIARKAKCVGPLFNKGGYQYIYNEQAAKDAGK